MSDVDGGDDHEDPFPGVWKAVPGTGTKPNCPLLMAEDPASLRSKWIPCPSGRVGCRQLDTSWTKRGGLVVETEHMTDPARFAAGKAILKMRRNWPNKDVSLGLTYAYVDVVEPLDGDPVMAIGGPPVWVKGSDGRPSPRHCFIRAVMGDYGVGYHAREKDLTLGLNATSSDALFGWAPWTSPSTFTTKSVASKSWATEPSMPQSTEIYFPEATMGERGFWLGARAPTTAAFFDVFTQTPKLTKDPPLFFFSEYPIAVPGGALVFDVNAHAIARVKEDGTYVRLVTPTSPQRLTWKVIDRSNVDTLVWVESDYGAIGYTNSTLWAAPLVATEGELVRRKVAKLTDVLERGGSRAVANRGVFLSLVGRNRALLTRLSDGMGWYIDAEPKERLASPVWVDDDNVLIEVSPDNSPTIDQYPSGVMRIARSALGAPTVLSGL